MVSTSTVRDWWYLSRCSYGTSTHMFGRTPVWAQRTDHVRALEAAHLGAGYVPTPGGYIGSRRDCPHGISGHDCQESGSWCSLHNYGLAWDVEYQFNPHFKRRLSESDLRTLHDAGKTKYNPDIIDRILEVENTYGETLFRTLAYVIGDTMHWQINVPPERSQVDWTTIPDYDGGTDMALSKGAAGVAVEMYQLGILEWNAAALPKYGADGDFGAETEEWVRLFQTGHDVASNGIIEGVSGSLILSYTSGEGAQGEQGEPGPKGATGAKGDTGATGAQGVPGEVLPGTVLELSNRAVVTEVV